MTEKPLLISSLLAYAFWHQALHREESEEQQPAFPEAFYAKTTSPCAAVTNNVTHSYAVTVTFAVAIAGDVARSRTQGMQLHP